MNKLHFYRQCLRPFLVFLSISSWLAGCAWVNSFAPTPEPLSSPEEGILLFPEGNTISLSASNRSKFIVNLLGPDYLEVPSSTTFYWVEARASDVIANLNERLSDTDWQVETDWGHRNALILSSWKKETLELSILLFDDLDAVGIDSLSKNYGISGPVTGSTLLVMHMRDLLSP